MYIKYNLGTYVSISTLFLKIKQLNLRIPSCLGNITLIDTYHTLSLTVVHLRPTIE